MSFGLRPSQPELPPACHELSAIPPDKPCLLTHISTRARSTACIVWLEDKAIKVKYPTLWADTCPPPPQALWGDTRLSQRGSPHGPPYALCRPQGALPIGRHANPRLAPWASLFRPEGLRNRIPPPPRHTRTSYPHDPPRPPNLSHVGDCGNVVLSYCGACKAVTFPASAGEGQ